MRLVMLIALVGTGCATAKLVGDRPQLPPDPGAPRTVVLEPLFEVADWVTSTRTEYAQVMGSGMMGSPGYSSFGSSGSSGMYGPNNVAITRQVTEKPLFAKMEVLNELHRRLVPMVQRMRPSWRVTSTGGAPVLQGNVTIVRTVIEGNEVVASNRTLKGATFVVGLAVWPLLIYTAQPVEESVLVRGMLERFDTTSSLLTSRLVRYPTQDDYAVNLAGVAPLRHEFGLELSYEEGYFADEAPRPKVLIDGFLVRLAAAVVAIVEESSATAPRPPAVPPAPPTTPPAPAQEPAK